MEDVKTMITDIKSKLDELENELLQLEQKSLGDSGDVNTEAERHRLALQEVLTDMQQRIDEYHELADLDGTQAGDSWKQMDQDLKDLDSDLYGAN